MPDLTLAQANKIIDVALAKAREMKIKPLAVAVLDQSGNVRSLQREDGASMFRCDVAIGKAYASVGMGVASRTLLSRAKENPQFFGALAATAQGKFLPQTGAVVIRTRTATCWAPRVRAAARARRTRRCASPASRRPGWCTGSFRETTPPARS